MEQHKVELTSWVLDYGIFQGKKTERDDEGQLKISVYPRRLQVEMLFGPVDGISLDLLYAEFKRVTASMFGRDVAMVKPDAIQTE